MVTIADHGRAQRGAAPFRAGGPTRGAEGAKVPMQIFDGDIFRKIRVNGLSLRAEAGVKFLKRNNIAINTICESPRVGPQLEAGLEKLGEYLESGLIKSIEDLGQPIIRDWGSQHGFAIMGLVRDTSRPYRILEIFYCDRQGNARYSAEDLIFARLYGGKNR